MLGKKCTLCGGKLNHENVCIECGLDNGKSDKNYKVNQSSCDRKPLTHVHEEAVSKKKEKKGKRKIAAIAVVTSILFSLISAAGDTIGDIFTDVFYQIEKLFTSESGSDYDYEETEDEFDTVRVEDYENRIYLYEYEGKGEDNYMDDLRLYRGAHVMIDAGNPVQLSTENAQLSDMHGMENPLTENVLIDGSKTRTAGEDFKEGIYDLERVKGEGFVTLVIYEDSEVLMTERS